MKTVSIRELRNRGGEVVDRVESGEAVTITRDGRPVAELRPVAPTALSAEAVLQRWRLLPRVDARTLRREIDELVDQAL